MRNLLLLLCSCLTAFGQITYPVNTNDTFTFKLGEQVRRGIKWPRSDGMQLIGAPTNLIILREVRPASPTYDEATQKLGAGVWTDDAVAATATFNRPVVALTQAELDAIAFMEGLAAKRTNLSGSIATLRTWADQAAGTTVTSGNAVATLQTVVTRLGVFFDHFADLLETQE